MEQMRTEVALATTKELLEVKVNFFFPIQKMSDKCFEKCVSKPGSALDSSEQVYNFL